VRRSGRSMNRKDRDRGAEMRLTDGRRYRIIYDRWTHGLGTVAIAMRAERSAAVCRRQLGF